MLDCECKIQEVILNLIIFFFQKMDRNRDGVVTIEEFMESCQKVHLYHSLLLSSECKTNKFRHKYSKPESRFNLL